MRLTVNLEDDLYRIARNVAREEEISVSKAINILLRRTVERPPSNRGQIQGNLTRAGLPKVAGKQSFSAEEAADFLNELS